MTTPAHTRHHGLIIDTSFNRDGTPAYYVVEGGPGRFTTLRDAKLAAEGRALRRGRRS